MNYPIYDLTPLTRHANNERRVVMWGFDFSRRILLLVIAGGLAGAMVAAVFSVFIGWYALLFVPVGSMVMVWLVEERSTQGMKLKNWQTLMDKHTSAEGKFFICGHEIDVSGRKVTVVRSLTAPVERRQVAVEDLFQ